MKYYNGVTCKCIQRALSRYSPTLLTYTTKQPCSTPSVVTTTYKISNDSYAYLHEILQFNMLLLTTSPPSATV